MNLETSSLNRALIGRKNTIVEEWLRLTLRTYPEPTTQFLSQENDPFRNPVGTTFRKGLAALFDELVSAGDLAATVPVLDRIVRIRAVQNFTASQAVAFVFLLKQVVRGELGESTTLFAGEYAILEARIDKLALLAFDIFVKCREQIFEIKAKEAKRMVYVLERSQQRKSSGIAG